MNNIEGKWIEVQGYKHDGRMHRIRDSVYILEETEEYIVAASTKTKVIEHDFRIWYTKEPAIMIYFKNCWRNVIAMLKTTGITYYVNLASPYIYDCQKIKYIDYDFDIKLYPTKESKLIDVKEYEYHRKIFNYSNEIDSILKYNIKKIQEKMKKAEFPFIDESIKNYYETFSKKTKKAKKNENWNY